MQADKNATAKMALILNKSFKSNSLLLAANSNDNSILHNNQTKERQNEAIIGTYKFSFSLNKWVSNKYREINQKGIKIIIETVIDLVSKSNSFIPFIFISIKNSFHKHTLTKSKHLILK